jgi:hypothetical protein
VGRFRVDLFENPLAREELAGEPEVEAAALGMRITVHDLLSYLANPNRALTFCAFAR